ncbi:carbohydrate ABC transporter permease [Mycoplasmopsis columbinasalis]|uniref:Inner membrane ABC transporter permease protein ycjP n=1 Tax=Mycoplasmopsis columbinasalis TaxID=114880 RepID=A0A449B9P1_9BACT|nr:carbohydrate ABC transporter permease [Mycoplasmopsis columbinasalis]VEU77910.1 Inner membrane ABC transporter permease protein ycjP [Mycoplasmopsis columbinasalis]
MFEKKLKLQQWFLKKRLSRNKEITANQVHETRFSAMAGGLFLKMLALSFFALIVLFPFFFMIMIALMSKEQADALKTDFSLIPTDGLHFENFGKAAKGSLVTSYGAALGLTFTNVLFSIVFKTLITMLAGYAFALKRWKGKNILWSFFIALLVLPEIALLSGQYAVIIYFDNTYQIRSSYGGMVTTLALPFIASVFSALMFRNAFEAIPNRIKEVAAVDGATGAKYFFKVAVPMVTPTMLTVIILTALASWNSYLWPSLVVPASSNYRVLSLWIFEVGIDRESLDSDARVLQNIKMAGVILAILPMFGAYLLFRKRIMRSISKQGSTIKG